MDYYDRKYVEDYMCSRLSVFYQSRQLYDAIGTKAWTEILEYKFKCELLMVVNSRIRMHFWLPYSDDTLRGNFTNDSELGNGRQHMSDEELQQVYFLQSSSFWAQLKATFSSDLDGHDTFSWFFHSKEHNETTKYNNWNFTTPKVWDSVEHGFWFAEKTEALWRTQNYIVGKN